jgi:hypothetical protein
MTQKKFWHFVSSDWPSGADFLKVTVAASGLFVYAEVVMQFIRDSEHADPASRLEILLSVIDRSTAVPTKDNPFVQLDALYHEILSSIPSALWPAAKQLLSFTIHGQSVPIVPVYTLPNFHTLRGMSVLFGLSRYTIYACLIKCRSTLKIPNWNVAHKQKLTFFHASFVDYLTDRSRSGDFSVAYLYEVVGWVTFGLLEVWNKCSGDGIAVGMSDFLGFGILKLYWLQLQLNLHGAIIARDWTAGRRQELLQNFKQRFFVMLFTVLEECRLVVSSLKPLLS